MKNIDLFLQENIFHNITYEEYVSMFNNVILENKWNDSIKQIMDFKYKVLYSFFLETKNTFEQISKEFKLSYNQLIIAFKNKSFFELCKFFKFSLTAMFNSILSITELIRKGLFQIFIELENTKVFKKLKEKTIKIDEVLNKYPLLKKVVGISVAGLLLYMWLNMTFIGNPEYDLNLESLMSALHGNFSLATIFSSPSGLALLTLFATGLLSGGVISFIWLGKKRYNLILALLYTLSKKIKNNEMYNKLINIIKKNIIKVRKKNK